MAELRIFCIAGEASGDLLGGRLMAALKSKTNHKVRFTGVGGAQMRAEGLQSLFPMEELSVMGVAEILPQLPNLLKRIAQTADAIERTQPDAVITIDSPDFCFRVIKKLKKRGVKLPCIHYVAPSVWAWRPGRARKVAQFLDHILALLPFEPPYFEKEGLSCSFVGHSVIESGAADGDAAAFRKKHGLSSTQKLLCVLPGSRKSEISRLLTVFMETVTDLQKNDPDMQVVIPTLPHLAPLFDGLPCILVQDQAEKYNAFAAADAALAASGTVALELAMADTPSVISYRLSPISAWLAKRLIKLDHVSLVNIVAERTVMPELLLEDCKPDLLVKALQLLLEGSTEAKAQKEAFKSVVAKLGGDDTQSPSLKAADAVLNVINNNQ